MKTAKENGKTRLDRDVKWQTDNATTERMRRVRRKNTNPEVRLRHALFALGLRYRLHSKNLPGSPDIVLPRYRTVIFVHGCFWHQHKNCINSTTPQRNVESWAKKFVANEKRDARVQEELIAADWNVIVVWECEIRKDLAGVTEEIIKRLSLYNSGKVSA